MPRIPMQRRRRAMTPVAAAELIFLGILAGFFVSRMIEQATARKQASLDEETYAQLEQAIEAALERRIAEGGLAVATTAPAPTVTEAEAAVETEEATAVAEAEAPPAEEEAPGAPEGEVVTMKVTTIDGETHTLEVNSGENMLDAALDRDVDLEYSCKDGGCDTCTVKVLAGMEFLEPIYDEERDMLDDDELASGHRLSCLIHVRGPVEIVQEER